MTDQLDRVMGWVRHMLAHRRNSYISLFAPYTRSSELDHDERRRQEAARTRLFVIEQELDRINRQILQQRDQEDRP